MVSRALAALAPRWLRQGDRGSTRRARGGEARGGLRELRGGRGGGAAVARAE